MSQTINTNLNSLNAQKNLSMSQSSLATSMQRLSSGLRVNSAADDAAGLSIAERMTSQVRGMAVAGRNANDAISLAQTAEGALGSVGSLFQRMRELAVQAANATNSTTDRASLNQEFGQLAQEATRTLGGTQFNGKSILSDTNALNFQIGANTTTAGTSGVDQISVDGFGWSANSSITTVLGSSILSGPLSDTSGVIITTNSPALSIAGTDGTAAAAVISKLDDAINAVNTQRGNYGAVQNRFNNVVSNLQTASENQTAARSRIMDADYAVETSNLSRANILQQAGNAMVAQANQLPQQVLSLLR
jgi:flagellin